MAHPDSPAIQRETRRAFRGGVAAGASDAELLDRFRRRGDESDREAETAFEVLVERHGPMVMAVCRAELDDAEDAADAFQATFLILIRKADSVVVKDTLGRWLYGVARRVARKARARARLRRLERTGPTSDPRSGEIVDPLVRSETVAILREELRRLPEPFREAITHCDLAGMSHEAFARRIGHPVGTIESRLHRGRERLRERLLKRGINPSASLAPLGLASRHSIPTRAALFRPSNSVLRLSRGVLTEMTISTLRLPFVGLCVALVAGGLAFRAVAQAPSPDKNPVAGTQAGPSKKTELQPPRKIQVGDRIRIEVLESLPGRPITGERIVRPDGTVSLDWYGDLEVAGLTRVEIKEKLLAHLWKYLSDSALGLERQTSEGEKVDPTEVVRRKPFVQGNERGEVTYVRVKPRDSDRIFVDDSANFDPETSRRQRDEHLDRRLNALEESIRALSSSRSPISNDWSEKQEKRLDAIERKLDELLKSQKAVK